MSQHTVTLIPGDGIGIETSAAMQKVVQASGAEITWEVAEAGSSQMEKYGTPLPESTIESVKRNKVAIKGPITTPVGTGFRSVNVALRKTLNLNVCLRPVVSIPGAGGRYSDVDLVIVRENSEDLYAGIEFEEGSEGAAELINFCADKEAGIIRPDSGISIKPISITEYNFHSADGVLSDGGLPTEAYEAISNNRLYSFDNWRLEMELAPSSEINEYMRVTSTFTGGKLRSKTEYAEDLDHPVKHESYSYGYYQSEDPINVYTAYLCQAVNHLYRTNAIYQNQKITELYNKDSVLIYNNETKYLVNDLGRTSAVVQTDSKGDEIREMYSYLDRVPAYPTEIIKTNKGNVISAMKIDYEQQRNAEHHYTPSKVWKGAVGVTPPNIEYRPDCIYSHYDTHGNPRQVVDKNGKTTCYFWGYNGRHIVAKIENSTYNILLGYGIGTTYSEALPADVEAQLRNDEEENFIVTTYTYKPLVGITSITDPSGHSVYYEYNDSGKLKVIRDDKGKVLKSYDYHIVTDNQ